MEEPVLKKNPRARKADLDIFMQRRLFLFHRHGAIHSPKRAKIEAGNDVLAGPIFAIPGQYDSRYVEQHQVRSGMSLWSRQKTWFVRGLQRSRR